MLKAYCNNCALRLLRRSVAQTGGKFVAVTGLDPARLHLLLGVLVVLADAWIPLSLAADAPVAPAADAALTAQMKQALQGQIVSFKDTELKKEALAEAQMGTWAAYKAAAVGLGWDKTLMELPPTLDALQALPPEELKKHRLSPAVLSCDAETMPYFLLAKGQAGASGWPLFFQTHGGGSTNDKLPNPHGWSVNTHDWMNQVGVVQNLLPPGMYFVPRMANDNKGRWWYRHNMTAFDQVIRCAILFRNVDPNRIYMMGISEGAYGTEALTPFWADRFAGGCAMAGGAGAGERLYCLRNTAFRSDTGEKDTMFGRAELVQKEHAYLDDLKKSDPEGYDHSLNLQPEKGHGIDYRPGPAWLAVKARKTRPSKVCWFNFKLDGVRRTDFYWLGLSAAPADDALIIAQADRASNTVRIDANMNPPGVNESPVYAAPPPKIEKRTPLAGTDLIVYLDDQLLDLDKPVTIVLNGQQVFSKCVQRSQAVMSDTVARFGDPGRIFCAKIVLSLPRLPDSPSSPAANSPASGK